MISLNISRIERSSGHLSIEYQIRNSFDRATFLLIQPRDIDQAYPHDAYRYLSTTQDCLQLWLGQARKPVIEGINLGSQISPLATTLEPNSVFESRLELSLPLREWDAYSSFEPDSPIPNGLEQVAIRRFQMVVEYLFEDEAVYVDSVGELFCVGGPSQSVTDRFILDDPVSVYLSEDEFMERTEVD